MTAKEVFRISVRELAERAARAGDLGGGFGSRSDAYEAIKRHQALQAARGPDYRREVPVSLTLETDLLVVKLGGRIDGVLTGPGRPVIEEIKTVTGDPEDFRHNPDPRHLAQARTYAWLYCLENGLEEAAVRLTYCRLGGGRLVEVEEILTRAELEAHFNALMTRYLAWAHRLAAWHRLRNESLSGLSFPYADYRGGQLDLVEAVFQTVEQGGRLLAEAPTGIGKTMAVLYPSVLSLGRGRASRIFYLTARTTGRLATQQALDELRSAGANLRSVSLTAKSKICFRPDAACKGEECEYARGYYDRLDSALESLGGMENFTRETVETAARKYGLYPFELSLDLALEADCVVGDYNYVFDPRAGLKRFQREPTSGHVLLVDEAHNLAERAREMFSADLSEAALVDLAGLIGDRYPGLTAALEDLTDRLDGSYPDLIVGSAQADEEPPAWLGPLIDEYLCSAAEALREGGPPTLRDLLAQSYFDLAAFRRALDWFDYKYASLAVRDRDGLNMKLFCLDPSARLAAVHGRAGASVFFSGTLTPADYYGDLLGCGEEARRLSLPSPFPAENLCLLVCPTVSTVYRRRAQTASRVAALLSGLVRPRPGNYLFFFPSYQYLDLIHAAFTAENPGLTVIRQRPGLSEQGRIDFLDRFQEGNGSSLVGFAVMGGVFGEGVDLAGDRLTGAALVGVGTAGIGAGTGIAQAALRPPQRGRVRIRVHVSGLHSGAPGGRPGDTVRTGRRSGAPDRPALAPGSVPRAFSRSLATAPGGRPGRRGSGLGPVLDRPGVGDQPSCRYKMTSLYSIITSKQVRSASTYGLAEA